jgi:GTPase Era involved in 16S rRNA processing
MSSYGKSNLLNAMVTEDTIITQKNSQALLGEVREEKRKEICVL